MIDVTVEELKCVTDINRMLLDSYLESPDVDTIGECLCFISWKTVKHNNFLLPTTYRYHKDVVPLYALHTLIKEYEKQSDVHVKMILPSAEKYNVCEPLMKNFL